LRRFESYQEYQSTLIVIGGYIKTKRHLRVVDRLEVNYALLYVRNNVLTIKYSKELLEEAVKNSYSWAGVLRYLGLKQAGGTQCHVKSRANGYNLNYSHFTGRASNAGKFHKGGARKRRAEEILIERKEGSLKERTDRLRRALLEIGKEDKCEECGLEKFWNGKPINMQIHHKNGNNLDNRLGNLAFLCANCHSQQPNSHRTKQVGVAKWQTRNV
jgi:hypothetical protein